MLRVLDMKYNTFLTPVLGRFFHGSGSGFFRIGSGFLADPDPDSEKRLIRIREKTRIRNTGKNSKSSTCKVGAVEIWGGNYHKQMQKMKSKTNL